MQNYLNLSNVLYALEFLIDSSLRIFSIILIVQKELRISCSPDEQIEDELLLKYYYYH